MRMWWVRFFLFFFAYTLEIEVKAFLENEKNKEEFVLFPSGCVEKCSYRNMSLRPLTHDVFAGKVSVPPGGLFSIGEKSLIVKKKYALIESMEKFRVDFPQGRLLLKKAKVLVEFLPEKIYQISFLSGEGALLTNKQNDKVAKLNLTPGYSYQLTKIGVSGVGEVEFPMAIEIFSEVKKWTYLMDKRLKSEEKEIKRALAKWPHYTKTGDEFLNHHYQRRVASLQEEHRLELERLKKQSDRNRYLRWLFRKKNYLVKEAFTGDN